jgi:hypothetical protein
MNDVTLISILNDYADDYGVVGLLEELFGEDINIGEIVADMWNAGLIPTDVMDKFLLDD